MMASIERVRVACLDQIDPGRGTPIRVGGHNVALFIVEQRLLAVEDWCLCCGRSLASGLLGGTLVKCAGCGWQYDLVTGGVTGVPALRIDTFGVKVVGSDVLLELHTE
jgi:nitrite reductase/ring-hydroxylating ferredoxin subunit